MEEEKGTTSGTEEKKENTKQDGSNKGHFYISIAIGILIFLPLLSYPYVYMYLYEYVDTAEYLFRKGLNVARYITLAIFLFTIGVKYLFDGNRED